MSIHSSMYSLDTYCSTSMQCLEIVFTTVLALNVGVLHADAIKTYVAESHLETQQLVQKQHAEIER